MTGKHKNAMGERERKRENTKKDNTVEGEEEEKKQ